MDFAHFTILLGDKDIVLVRTIRKAARALEVFVEGHTLFIGDGLGYQDFPRYMDDIRFLRDNNDVVVLKQEILDCAPARNDDYAVRLQRCGTTHKILNQLRFPNPDVGFIHGRRR